MQEIETGENFIYNQYIFTYVFHIGSVIEIPSRKNGFLVIDREKTSFILRGPGRGKSSVKEDYSGTKYKGYLESGDFIVKNPKTGKTVCRVRQNKVKSKNKI